MSVFLWHKNFQSSFPQKEGLVISKNTKVLFDRRELSLDEQLTQARVERYDLQAEGLSHDDARMVEANERHARLLEQRAEAALEDNTAVEVAREVVQNVGAPAESTEDMAVRVAAERSDARIRMAALVDSAKDRVSSPTKATYGKIEPVVVFSESAAQTVDAQSRQISSAFDVKSWNTETPFAPTEHAAPIISLAEDVKIKPLSQKERQKNATTAEEIDLGLATLEALKHKKAVDSGDFVPEIIDLEGKENGQIFDEEDDEDRETKENLRLSGQEILDEQERERMHFSGEKYDPELAAVIKAKRDRDIPRLKIDLQKQLSLRASTISKGGSDESVQEIDNLLRVTLDKITALRDEQTTEDALKAAQTAETPHNLPDHPVVLAETSILPVKEQKTGGFSKWLKRAGQAMGLVALAGGLGSQHEGSRATSSAGLGGEATVATNANTNVEPRPQYRSETPRVDKKEGGTFQLHEKNPIPVEASPSKPLLESHGRNRGSSTPQVEVGSKLEAVDPFIDDGMNNFNLKKFGETYKTEGRRTLQHDKTDRALYTKTKNGLVRYDYTPEGRIQSVSLQYLAGENKKIQTIKVNPESGQVLGGGVNADSLQSMVSDVQNTLNADIMSL